MAKTRTLKTILAQIEELMAEAEAIRQQERPKVIADLRELIHQYGIPAADLRAAATGSMTNPAPKKSGLPPLYKDPASGATWTGRGPAPSWMRDAPDRSVFLINDAAKGKAQATQLSAASNVATDARKTAGRNQGVERVAPLKTTPRLTGSPKETKRASKAAHS